MKKLMMTVAAVAFAAAVAYPDVARAACERLLPGKINACEGSDFCGVWGEAKWDGVLPHCLAVEGSSGNFNAIYAWGKAPRWNIHSPGLSHNKARVEGDTLKFRTPNGARVTYKMVDGRLRGTYRGAAVPRRSSWTACRGRDVRRGACSAPVDGLSRSHASRHPSSGRPLVSWNPGQTDAFAALDPGSGAGVTPRARKVPLPSSPHLACHPGQSEATIRGPGRPPSNAPWTRLGGRGDTEVRKVPRP